MHTQIQTNLHITTAMHDDKHAVFKQEFHEPVILVELAGEASQPNTGYENGMHGEVLTEKPLQFESMHEPTNVDLLSLV